MSLLQVNQRNEAALSRLRRMTMETQNLLGAKQRSEVAQPKLRVIAMIRSLLRANQKSEVAQPRLRAMRKIKVLLLPRAIREVVSLFQAPAVARNRRSRPLHCCLCFPLPRAAQLISPFLGKLQRLSHLFLVYV